MGDQCRHAHSKQELKVRRSAPNARSQQVPQHGAASSVSRQSVQSAGKGANRSNGAPAERRQFDDMGQLQREALERLLRSNANEQATQDFEPPKQTISSVIPGSVALQQLARGSVDDQRWQGYEPQRQEIPGRVPQRPFGAHLPSSGLGSDEARRKLDDLSALLGLFNPNGPPVNAPKEGRAEPPPPAPWQRPPQQSPLGLYGDQPIFANAAAEQHDQIGDTRLQHDVYALRARLEQMQWEKDQERKATTRSMQGGKPYQRALEPSDEDDFPPYAHSGDVVCGQSLGSTSPPWLSMPDYTEEEMLQQQVERVLKLRQVDDAWRSQQEQRFDDVCSSQADVRHHGGSMSSAGWQDEPQDWMRNQRSVLPAPDRPYNLRETGGVVGAGVPRSSAPGMKEFPLRKA